MYTPITVSVVIAVAGVVGLIILSTIVTGIMDEMRVDATTALYVDLAVLAALGGD